MHVKSDFLISIRWPADRWNNIHTIQANYHQKPRLCAQRLLFIVNQYVDYVNKCSPSLVSSSSLCHILIMSSICMSQIVWMWGQMTSPTTWKA